MKKMLLSLLASVLFMAADAAAQGKYFTKNANISFYSSTPVEDIEAHNKNATCVLNAETGAIEFAVLIKAFEFEKALMQEHFNENYMESNKYPKSTFKGQIENIKDINFGKDGTYKAKIKGQLTIHGETKPVETTGTIEVKGGKVTGTSTFMVAPQDYKIEIPKLVREKIAREIKVTVLANFQPLNK